MSGEQFLFEVASFFLAVGLTPFILMCVYVADRQNDLCTLSYPELVFGQQNPCQVDNDYTGKMFVVVEKGFENDVISYLFHQEPKLSDENVTLKKTVSGVSSCNNLPKHLVAVKDGSNVTIEGSSDVSLTWYLCTKADSFFDVRSTAIYTYVGTNFHYEYESGGRESYYVVPYYADCYAKETSRYLFNVLFTSSQYDITGAAENYTGSEKITLKVKPGDFIITQFKNGVVLKQDTIKNTIEIDNAISKILWIIILAPILFVIFVPLSLGCFLAPCLC